MESQLGCSVEVGAVWTGANKAAFILRWTQFPNRFFHVLVACIPFVYCTITLHAVLFLFMNCHFLWCVSLINVDNHIPRCYYMPLLVIISVTGTESGVPGSLRVTIDHCSHRLWFGGRGSCTKEVQDGSYRYLLFSWREQLTYWGDE